MLLRFLNLAHLEIGLAYILMRFSQLRVEHQGFPVQLNGFVVLLQLAIGVAHVTVRQSV